MPGLRHTGTLREGLTRREIRAAQTIRENALRPGVHRFLSEINAAVPRAALVAAARARTLDDAMLDRLMQHATTRMDEAIRSWQRPLEELLIHPDRGVKKSIWDELPLELLRFLARDAIGDLIRELTVGQLETVRTQLAAVMRHGSTAEILTAIADTTGLTSRQSQAVTNTFERVLAETGSAASAAAAADRHRERLLDYRAGLIARTEATRYLGAVVARRAREMMGHVVKAWVSARDLNVDSGDVFGPCAIADDGLWYELDEPFQNDLMQPPAHPGCRCLLEIMTVDQAAVA